MHELPENLKIRMSEFTISAKNPDVTVPIMEVYIEGIPSLGDVKKLMDNIRETAKSINGKYVAVTDLTKLKINQLLRSLILYGMEKTYKSFLSVSNQASLSFVILTKDEKTSRLITSSLQRINNDIAKEDYTYRYFFIENQEQMFPIIQNYFASIREGAPVS